MTQEYVQFSQANIVGLGISSPGFCTVRWMIPRVGTLDMSPWKRVRRKEFSRAFSTRRNACSMFGVT